MKANMEGQKVPSVTFKTRQGADWVDVKSDKLFKGRTVVVFSLPGAFTPTCSSTHLPSYNRLASKFKKNGVDEIVCLSVNDAFVMNAWAEDQDSDNVTLLPDGNGEFSEKMGMLVDKTAIGFGKRSWRYSMLVKDGVVQKMFVEPEKEGDPFEVSDAETMLKYINPKEEKETQVTIFTRPGCPHCARAKTLLKEKGLHYEEIPLTPSVTVQSLKAITGRATVPQVFINGKHIGGADDLEKHLK